MPAFGECTVEEIDRALCLRFKARLLGDARELRAGIEAGRVLRDERGRRRKPLGPASIRDVLQVLGAILDEAVEDELLESYPARGKRMRVRVPKPNRTFLEMDELTLLLQAAGEQDMPLHDAEPQGKLGLTTLWVARLVEKSYQPTQIARRLGLAPGTVSFHLRRLGVRVGRGYIGRRVAVEILARSGVRVSELCDLRSARSAFTAPTVGALRSSTQRPRPGYGRCR